MDMNIQAVIWRGLAQEAAAAAAQVHDPELRLSMLIVSAGYETMAKRAEAIGTEQVTKPGAEIAATKDGRRPSG